MEFRLAGIEGTQDVSAHLRSIDRIGDYLEIELSRRTYGTSVPEVIMGVNCIGDIPGYTGPRIELETGTVIHKKYTKSRRLLELTLKLNHREVISCEPGSDELVGILKRGVMGTYGEVKAMGMENFDVDAFYRDIGALIDDRSWVKNPEKYKKPPFVYKGPFPGDVQRGTKAIPQKRRMPDEDFWNLIRQSIDAGEGSVEKQIAYLEDSLATRSEKEIVGFELTLRELIRESHHHHVMALLKVIDGSVTDDSLLYFRCRLILYGQDVFRAAIENPNNLTQRLDSDGAAEYSLSVADKAFLKKFGGNTDKDLPSDVGASYIDYNSDSCPLLGRPWTERSFAKRYAALLKLYE